MEPPRHGVGRPTQRGQTVRLQENEPVADAQSFAADRSIEDFVEGGRHAEKREGN